MPRTLIRPKPLESATTPGVVNASDDHLRFCTGISVRAVDVNTDVISGLSKFSTAASAETFTVVVSAPVFSRGRIVVNWPTWTVTWSSVSLPKPAASIVTV